MDVVSIWPFNASNAAVPLAAAILGHLPSTADEIQFVQYVGVSVFLLSFVPLIFGGKVYRMLEWIMTLKLVVVLGYLTFIAVFMVSGAVIWDVATAFFRFGNVPLESRHHCRRPPLYDCGKRWRYDLHAQGNHGKGETGYRRV